MTGIPRARLLATGVLAVAAIICAAVMIVLAATGGQPASEPSAEPAPRTPSAPPTATATAGAGPAPAGSSDAERALLARLSSFELTGCQTATDEATAASDSRGPTEITSSGVTAALRCVPGVAGAGLPPASVVVLGYADSAAMSADAARRASAIVDVGACASGQTSSEAYLLPSRRTGTFLCQAAPGRFTTYWTIDREMIGFVAESDDPAGLITWWRGFDPL